MQYTNLEGQTLDNQYELVEFLGKGGMGAVYRAHQKKLKRDVAVKILIVNNLMDETHRRRFVREAETAASLEHPHIVPVYDFGTEQGMSYVVMRLLRGHSLAERMEQWDAGHMPHPTFEQIDELLQPICKALDYAHNQGVIHRDIKPSNVMFDDYDNPFLVDFGLVKLVDTSRSVLTHSGLILGTPAYMSPEQWQDDELTPSIDQYALGVIAYALVTGVLPFDAENPYDLMHMHCYQVAPPAFSLRSNIPVEISNILAKTLAKKAADRFPSIQDFAKAFRHAVYSSTGSIPVETQDTQGATITPSHEPIIIPRGALRVDQSRDTQMTGRLVVIDTFPFQIGRLNRDMNFDNDRNVSRNHAHITQNELGEFFIADQGSTLRTLVDDQEIPPYTPMPLHHNAQICLGTTSFLTFLIENGS